MGNETETQITTRRGSREEERERERGTVCYYIMGGTSIRGAKSSISPSREYGYWPYLESFVDAASEEI